MVKLKDFLENKSGKKDKLIAAFVTLAVIGLLLIAGPVNAFRIHMSQISDNDVVQGEIVWTVATITLADVDHAPLYDLVLHLEYANETQIDECTFWPNGTKSTPCSDNFISIEQISFPAYTLGYGYINDTGFGYGYEFGYGYNYDGANYLDYNITINTSGYPSGTHNLYLDALLQGPEGSVTVDGEDMAFTVNIDTTAPTVNLMMPPEYANASTLNMSFVFNATDDYDTELDCDLFIDDVYNASNSSTFNDTETEIIVDGFAEGAYVWNITCTDNFGNAGSAIRAITFDVTPPTISVVSPANGTNTNNNTVYFNITSNEPVNQWNFTYNGTVITPSQQDFTLTVEEGSHHIIVYMSDPAGNVGVNDSIYFTIDNTAPVVTLSGTPSGSSVPNNEILQFTPKDNLDSNMSCLLKINGADWFLYEGVVNNTFDDFSGNWLDGFYNWSVNCSDDAGNIGYSEVWNFTSDTAAPIVNLSSPLNESYINNLRVNFTFVDNLDPSITCGMYFNGSSIGASATNNTLYSTSLGTSNAAHNLYVNCTDDAGNAGLSETIIYVYDSINPQIEFSGLTPLSGSHINSTNILVQITVADVNLFDFNKTLYFINGTLLDFAQGTLQGNGSYQNSFGPLLQGSYLVNATAVDQAGNVNSTVTINVTLDTSTPDVTIVEPTATSYNISNVSLDFNAVDAFSQIDSCWYTVTGATEINATILPTCANITLENLTDGSQIVTVYANDSVGWEGSSSITFSVNTNESVEVTVLNTTVVDYTVNSTVDEDTEQITLVVQNGSAIENITIPGDLSDDIIVVLDLSLIAVSDASGVNVTLPQDFILSRESNSTEFNYTAELSAGTTILGPADWDGTLILPTVKSAGSYDITDGDIDVVVEMGSINQLNFTDPVKIVLGGMAGETAAWARSGETDLTEITTICNETIPAAPTNIFADVAPMECYRDNGDDLEIWTYHFTVFGAFMASTVTSSGGSWVTSWANTYTFTEDQMTAGLTQSLGIRQRVQFKLNGETHHVGLISFDDAAGSAIFELASVPFRATMTEGETDQFDITGDNMTDISVKVNSVDATSVDISVRALTAAESSAVTSAQETAPAATGEPQAGAETVKSSKTWVIVVVAIIIILLVLYLFLGRKKEEHHEGHHHKK